MFKATWLTEVTSSAACIWGGCVVRWARSRTAWPCTLCIHETQEVKSLSPRIAKKKLLEWLATGRARLLKTPPGGRRAEGGQAPQRNRAGLCCLQREHHPR